jgi:hypothetical protein
MKTVAKCRDMQEAELLKSRLESAGIPAFVPDTLSWYDGLIMFMGGFRVQVSDEHAETARQLLQTIDNTKEEV